MAAPDLNLRLLGGPRCGSFRKTSSGAAETQRQRRPPEVWLAAYGYAGSRRGYRARAVTAVGGDLALERQAIVLAWRNGPRLDGRNLMRTLMIDFITSLDG